MIGGATQAALFVGERIEYQVEIEGQGEILIYGERHNPIDEGSKVWLKLRPEGHSAWASNWLRRKQGSNVGAEPQKIGIRESGPKKLNPAWSPS